MTRTRLRDLGITLGRWPTGPYNAITDVPDVLVGHTTLIYDEPRIARTGVTVILPRRGDIWHDNAPAAYHSFNGCGEMTGLPWIEESGVLSSPIGITNTHQVRPGARCAGHVCAGTRLLAQFTLPVAAETYDGWLNDADAHHVTKEHVYAAIDNAQSGAIAEGCVGGGTGMICHDFKGGIGTSSRVVENESGRWTVGVLVQANHGDRDLFRVDGVPVGREINRDGGAHPRRRAPHARRGIDHRDRRHRRAADPVAVQAAGAARDGGAGARGQRGPQRQRRHLPRLCDGQSRARSRRPS